MIRHLVRNLQRVLQVPTAAATTPNVLLQRRTIFHMDELSAAEKPQKDPDPNATHAGGIISSEYDSEYIQPYCMDRERITTVSELIKVLRTRFRLTSADVKRITGDEQVVRNFRGRSLVSTFEMLCLVGVTKASFLAHPWLVTLSNKKRLEHKLTLLNMMHVRDINHFVVFLRLTESRLQKLVTALSREADVVPFKNRVYYISDKLNVDPSVVTKYLAKRLFVLEMPFEMLEANLDHMLHYKVSPTSILKDLWAFRYAPKSVQLRFERAKRAKKDKIMPWMVRCPESILQRSLQLSVDELKVLGDKSITEYVAVRLGFSVEATKAIMDKHPQVNTVRVTKIKEVLDYLLDEAGFTRYEIAQVPRILCHSLDTTKQRLEELKKLGCRPSTLVILCRSKREYEKFIQSWMGTHPKELELTKIHGRAEVGGALADKT